MPPETENMGSRDGATGGGDHDEPYRWGYHPNPDDCYPFTGIAFARLMILRSKIREGLACADDLRPEPLREFVVLPTTDETAEYGTSGQAE